MLGSDGTATNAEMFRKQWQKMINHPGKARQRFKDEFDETVLTAGGVRFFMKYEQVFQLATHGLDNIMNGIVPWCIEKNVSEGSSKKLLEMFNHNTETKANLGLAMVEMAAVADGLKCFCKGCYILEGDAQLILRAKSLFDRMENKMMGGEVDMQKLKAAVDKDLPMTESVNSKLSTELANRNDALGDIGRNVTEVGIKLQVAIDNRDELRTGGTSRGGRLRRHTERAVDMDQLEECTINIGGIKVELKDLKKR